MAGVSAVNPKTTSSLDFVIENGTVMVRKPGTIKTNLGQNNFLKDSNQRLSINNITPISAGDSLKDFIDGLAYLAKEIAVTTYDESKVCIKNGDIQKCLSTCGIAGDAIPVIGTGVQAACDGTNSLIYLFHGEYKVAGLSTIAILPYAGTVAKQGGKAVVKLEKEALEVAGKVSGKAVMKAIKYESPSKLWGRQLDREYTKSMVDDIANSMKKNGYEGPPVEFYEVNGRKIITDGHHRALASKKAGIDSIPVIELSAKELLDKWRLTPSQLEDQAIEVVSEKGGWW